MSRINEAVEAVMDLINAFGTSIFSGIRRGALGTDCGLVCEVGPSGPLEVYLDKGQYIPLDLTINGKHSNLETLLETMNGIHENLTHMKSYPSGDGWEIVDITTSMLPQRIGREDSGAWLVASSLIIKIFEKG